MAYQHILLAIDLTEESGQVADKAVAMAQQGETQLSMIHVIEPLSFAYGGDVPMDLSTIQEQLDEHAQQRLETFADNLGVPVAQLHVVSGHTESEIHRVAKEIGADLIIVGSHGRHGLSLLLGSTANGVLHGAKCDVLAVRVQESSA
ncbi:universal stress protein [Motiliproteus coralliicola]|uniref:Universal stress protein n=1 Tax=Motiliproteus coralliicola TaxID=2283196 RepID=A0A369WQF1_9GAMM|nr:universal stress protein [Motiliproteus coralliicola]RDE24318.1 universal stress protein [Motiliproteus coralliicola]